MAGQKILLIDDSKAVTYIVKKFLEKEGYDVEVAQNAYRGLDFLREQSFDLIISDIMMPGMDGYEFADVVKKDEALMKIPLIFFTAKGDVSDEFHGYVTGAEHYVVKPVKKRDLLDKIEKALGIKSDDEASPELQIRRESLSDLNPTPKRKSSTEVPSGEAADLRKSAGNQPIDLVEIINIYGSMIEVMWAFSFDKLLTFENLNVIEQAIDKTCLDYPFMGHLAFSEDGIDLHRFKDKVKGVPLQDVNSGFSALIANFFELIIEISSSEDESPRRLCVLGDDAMAIADLESALAVDGYHIVTGELDDSALSTATSSGSEVVVVVLQAMEEPAVEACRNLREQINPSIPVVLVCNNETREARKLGYSAGMDEVLALPWSKLSLLRMVKKLLKNK